MTKAELKEVVYFLEELVECSHLPETDKTKQQAYEIIYALLEEANN